MKKYMLPLSLLLAVSAAAQTNAVYPDDFTDGKYLGKQVKITNHTYVISYVSDPYLAEFFPRAAGETVADHNSDEYNAISDRNHDTDMRLHVSLLPSDETPTPLGTQYASLVLNMTDGYENWGLYDWMYYEAQGRGPDIIYPTAQPVFPDATLLVCAANLRWYMTTLGNNGANTIDQFNLQSTKITKAMAAISADIYAFVEVEQNAGVLDTLANRLNSFLNTPGKWAAVDRGITDASSTYQSCGFIYNTLTVKPVGQYDCTISGGYRNRSPLQMFEETASGEQFQLNCLHLKAKSSYDDYEEERLEQVGKVATSLKNNAYRDPDILIVGDFNSYSAERPVSYLESQGYTEELKRYSPEGYSYRYDYNNMAPEFGYLDHVMSSATMSAQVVGAQAWHLNTSYKDYDYAYNKTNDDSMKRYADHDPVLIGLKLQKAATAISQLQVPHTAVTVENGMLTIKGVEQQVSVWTISGSLVTYAAGNITLSLPAGFYLIKADNDIHKVILK
ncbi:MAG: hypothetical protein IJ776_11520 [Paludibacteraceae bacterium]|nr:hypothetical protein [Paludibacteraceae bacterium]